MMQDQDGGWETVNDPAIVKKVAGMDGVKRMPRAQTSGQRVDPLVSAPPGLSPGQLKSWQKANIAQQTLKSLNDLRGYYDQNFNGTGASALSEYTPALLSPRNATLDKKIDSLLGPAKGAYRVDGEGSFSDADIALLQKTMPNRWSSDASNREAMSRLDNTLRGFIRNCYGAAGLTPSDIERAANGNQYVSPLSRRLPAPPPRQQAPQQPARPSADDLRRKYGLK